VIPLTFGTVRHNGLILLLVGLLSRGLVYSDVGQGQSPTFRSRLDAVRTDVTVIDNKTGKPVVGLSQRDFTVTENGTRQVVSTFVAEEGEALGNTSLAAGANAPGDGRTLLIILGAGTKEGTSDPYGGLARFIRERLRPTDRAAVMVWDRVTPFTADFDALARLTERRKRIPADVIPLMSADGLGRRDISPQTRAAIDRWLLPPDEAADFLRPVAPLVLGVPELEQDSRIWQRLNLQIVSSDLLKVAGGIELLRHQPGEKRLVLVSLIGLAIPVSIRNHVALRTSDQVHGIARRAADAGVALDLITTYGTPNPPSLDWSLALQAAQQVAAETGGEFTSLRTVEQQLARVDDGSRHGYVIGYVPSNPVEDGERRQISIAVNRKDVTLIYRRGYTARKELPALDARELIARTRLENAAMAPVDFDHIRVGATAAQTTGGSGDRQVRFDLTFGAANLSMPIRDGRRETTLDLMVLCGDQKGDTVGSLTQRVVLSVDEARYQQALKTGLPYSVAVQVKGRPVTAKVIVYSYADDQLGSVSLRIG
jgi:VWFA-related protein